MKKRIFANCLLPVFFLFAACTAASQESAASFFAEESSEVSVSASFSEIESSSESGESEASESSSESDPVSENSEESSEISEPEPLPPQEARAREILDAMTYEEKICQLFIITPEQLTAEWPVTVAGEQTASALDQNPVGGLIYFSQNLVSREQTEEMLQNTQSFAKFGLFLAVDEEGGNVARVASNPAMGTTAFPPMGQLENAEEAYSAGYTIGSELLALGFNLDFAPVADVNSNPENTVIGNRAFSSDPALAAEYVAACVRGFSLSGILCTLKHFPGHGDTFEDSHYGLAKNEKELTELSECEFLPFSAGIEAGAPLVMVGHIALPNVTGDDTPATLSRAVITGLLREELGFSGLVVTDSMQMQAITDAYSSGEAALMALEAGADLILLPQDFSEAKEYLLEALETGTLSRERLEESLLRILKTKITYGIIE